MSGHRAKARAELRHLANRSTCHFSAVLWGTTFIVYTYALAVYVQMSMPPCKCAMDSLSPDAAECSNYRSEDACDPARWALWQAADQKKLRNSISSRLDLHEITANASQMAQSEDRMADEHPFAKSTADKYRFYGKVDENSRLSPDRVLFTKFFYRSDIRSDSPNSQNPVRNGIFVDVGAGDGSTNSNSLFFEKELNWTGLVIEGAKPNIMSLNSSQARASRTRKVFKAVCNSSRQSQMIGEGHSAALTSVLSDAQRRKLVNEWSAKWKDPYAAQCELLGQILKENDIAIVDFLSVSVQGAELEALSGVDFNSVLVRVVVVDLPTSSGEMEEAVRELLSAKNFCMAARVGPNEYWTSDPVFKKYLCGWSVFRYPP